MNFSLVLLGDHSFSTIILLYYRNFPHKFLCCGLILFFIYILYWNFACKILNRLKVPLNTIEGLKWLIHTYHQRKLAPHYNATRSFTLLFTTQVLCPITQEYLTTKLHLTCLKQLFDWCKLNKGGQNQSNAMDLIQPNLTQSNFDGLSELL